ncbi:hypothetical protein CJ030_MR7G011625 [Morella rubra]|uniref:DUF4408 domain-containing protein n=1 Tax=Morella rubra TaxID=262757 RepID=A0A6A1V3K4_9ROSI|nr:hypothetical protein CJ030_MR7G011625 [Morella rubra]
MDSFRFYNIKAEKANAMLRYRQLQKIANLCRVIEVCLFLVLVSRLSMQLPLAVKNSGGYFRDLTVVFVSPRFVFVIGNAIVITLFVKSGQFRARDPTARSTSAYDLYEELIKNSEKNQKVHPDHDETWNPVKPSNSDGCVVKDYRRSQSYSQNPNSVVCEKPRSVLRRLETEKCLERSLFRERSEENSSYPEDELSNEEFQRKVEAFIARQQRIRKEEE